MGVTIFDLFGEIFSENDMINFLKENGIDPNGLIGGGLAIRCFLLLKDLQMVHVGQELLRINNAENNVSQNIQVIDEEIELEPVPSMNETSVNLHYDQKPNANLFEEPSSDSKQEKKTWTCKKSVKCKKEFNDKKELQRHESTFKHFTCQPCDKHFTARRQLQEHQKADDCAHLVCDKCGKNFKNMGPSKIGIFQDHIYACKNIRPFICEFCGDGFNQRSTWSCHIRRKHTVEGETKRQLGKDLQRAALESRRRNPRKFQCPECPQKYTTNQKLKYHRMVHGGVKIQCNSCLKLLSSPTALRSHMKTVHKKDKFSASDGTLVRAVDDDRRDDEVLELEAADAAGNQPTGHVRLEQPISTDESAAFDNLLDHPK